MGDYRRPISQGPISSIGTANKTEKLSKRKCVISLWKYDAYRGFWLQIARALAVVARETEAEN
jgi:hypothetical protein